MKFNIFLGALFFINTIFGSYKYPHKLLIKFPTRERSDKFFKYLDLYYKNLSGKIPYHFLISCDSDDASMNNNLVINKLKKYKNLTFYFGPNVNKIEAINRDINKHLDFDVLLIASDDMTPIVKNYDEKILNYMLKYFPDFDGALHFFDGHVDEQLITLPIVGRKYYNRFNYLYHPDYQSVFCDLEMTLVAKKLNKVKFINEIIIRHDHGSYGFTQDRLFHRNESEEYHKLDFKTFLERQAVNFDLKSNLIVQSSLNIFDSKKDNIELTIGIPASSINTQKFIDLYVKLTQQVFSLKLENKIEILFLKSNELSDEGKTAELERAKRGQYCLIIKDDLNISNDYIKNIYSNYFN